MIDEKEEARLKKIALTRFIAEQKKKAEKETKELFDLKRQFSRDKQALATMTKKLEQSLAEKNAIVAGLSGRTH